jgi:hypothetical protein
MLNFQDGTGCARPRSYSERPEAISRPAANRAGPISGLCKRGEGPASRAGLRESAWAGP